MPRYTVQDPETGKSIVLEGDSPPSEQELVQIFGATRQSQPSVQVAAPAQAGPTAEQLMRDPAMQAAMARAGGGTAVPGPGISADSARAIAGMGVAVSYTHLTLPTTSRV